MQLIYYDFHEIKSYKPKYLPLYVCFLENLEAKKETKSNYINDFTLSLDSLLVMRALGIPVVW